MTKGTRTYQWCIALLLCFVQTAGIAMYGQNRPRAAAKRQQLEHADSLKRLPQVAPDSLNVQTESALQRVSAADSLAIADSIAASAGNDFQYYPTSVSYTNRQYKRGT